ncbi:MAG: ATP-binding protein [Gaiellaceae bacterium]
MSRIPIRLRLTLPFAVAVAAVLAAMGVFIYLRVGGELISSVDSNLRAQVAEVKVNAEAARTLVDTDATDGPTVAQVLTPDGVVVASQPSALPALPHARRWQSSHANGLNGDWRFLALPETVGGERRILVVGRSLHAREETLHRLAQEYVIAAPVALLLAVLAGYGLAAAALRPVEAMRRRAAAVTAEEPGRRLPVPPARDEIRSLAVTINDMLARLEASFEHERRFLSDASHELRTPLALLRAELELALSRPRSRAELEAAVVSAAEETERLTRLAEDLLLIARADQGQLPIRAERVPVSDLLERVRARFSAHAAELGRAVDVDGDRDAAVVADVMRIEQALGNLVSNAFEHGDGTVTLRARTVDGRVELHVTDKGAGLPDGFVARAFDRFSRADDARGGGGAGLGLAIVELIARAHGGDAHLVNRPGGGSDAWISLLRAS